MLPFLAIVLATFASEDLMCVATGTRDPARSARCDGRHPGLHVGDLCWRCGAVGHRPPFRQGSPGVAVGGSPAAASHAGRCARLADRHAAGAIVGSRFLPGTRFALYVMSGILRMPVAVFSLWAFIAALLWTPTIVLLTATLGDAFVGRFTPLLGAGWTARLAAGAVALGLLQGVRMLVTKPRRLPTPRGPRRSIASVGVLADVVVLRACDDLDCAARDLASWTDDNHGCESGNAGRRNGRRVQIRHPRETPPRVHDSVPRSCRPARLVGVCERWPVTLNGTVGFFRWCSSPTSASVVSASGLPGTGKTHRDTWLKLQRPSSCSLTTRDL